MKQIKFLLAALFISCAGFFYSCQKDQSSSGSNPDLTSATDEALADNESNYVINTVNTLMLSAGLLGRTADGGPFSTLPDCATATWDTTADMRTLTIDFGTTPCLCSNWDNKYREGKIIATWSGFIRVPGTVVTITTSDYFVGYISSALNQFDFTKTITNAGLSAKGNLHFIIHVDGKVTLADGKTITYTANRDREWIQGAATITPDDDVFLITGSATGIDRNGEPFSVQITKPLKKDACAWLVSGTLSIAHTGQPTRELDYGDGTCDDLATITVNGYTRTIHLP